jgi:hypothetical protein
LELIYELEILVVVNFCIHNRKASKFMIGDYKIDDRCGFNKFLKILNQYGIKWEFYQKYCLGHQLFIKTEGNILVGFLQQEEKRELFYLTKIQLSRESLDLNL